MWSTSWTGGLQINAGHMHGRTALHYAAHRGYENVCDILLRRGARIDPDREGNYEYLHLKDPRKEWWTIDFLGIADTTETRDDIIFKESSEEELACSTLGLTCRALSLSTASLTQQAVFGL